MIKIKNKKDCSGCHACASVCVKQCIKMESDAEGFWYPQIDTDKCVDCGMCERVCPVLNKHSERKMNSTKAFAAINKNEEIRMQSSSGGIFTLLAEAVIEQGGVVFGAAFSKDFKAVFHICIDNVEDLQKLRGSKYVQSRIGDTYKQAKGFLEDGREVLFTGTPCQIAGLYSYLGKMYDNLYTQDIICHGVPSPMVWEQYVEMRENKAASKTQRMFFRYKKYGWKTFAVLFEFKNNTAYVKNLREDSFMRAFLSNSCLRQSCYSCSFKGLQREADITLADFWGIQNFLPEMDDDKGTSLVLIHTDGGEKLFELIKDKVKFQAVDISLVSMYNSAVVKSCEPNKRRSSFLKDIATKDFEKTVFRYTSGSKLRRLLGKIKRKLFR